MRVIAITLLLVGCTTVTPTFGPNGERLVYIECDYTGMPDCYAMANKACPGGYRQVGKVDTFTPGLLSSSVSKNITVACQ